MALSIRSFASSCGDRSVSAMVCEDLVARAAPRPRQRPTLVRIRSAEVARRGRELPDLPGDHVEGRPGRTGAGRFDAGVQRQEVGLLVDLADLADELFDFLTSWTTSSSR